MTTRGADFEKWNTLRTLNTGDKIELTNGESAIFTRLKQKKFIAEMNGELYDIHVNSFSKVLSRENIKDRAARSNEELKKGDPFYINKNGKALLFIYESHNEKGEIIGKNPITNGKSRIEATMYAGKVSEL